jgi:transposase, IS5 family
MDQITFSDLEYQHKKRKTRREKFLEKMELLIPWAQLEKKIRRHYPKAGRGRHPYPLSVMLRIHCMQLFYNVSDPAMEDLLYEIDSVRRFVGLKITGPIPDESTILKFRHLLESHDLGTKLFEVINQQLAAQGLMLKEGTIVDASIIAAPSSTKNQTGTRDPEMHQAKKGNQWHFGMKMHIGVDEELGLTHSLSTSAANVSDVTRAAELLHGDEQRVCGDSGYQGIDKRPEHQDREVEWKIAMRPGKRAVLNPRSRVARAERKKASVRAKVEHPFRYVKQVFGYAKVRYRGLHKNTQRLALLLGFTNLLIGDTYELA